jgi:hypothetical protein
MTDGQLRDQLLVRIGQWVERYPDGGITRVNCFFERRLVLGDAATCIDKVPGPVRVPAVGFRSIGV